MSISFARYYAPSTDANTPALAGVFAEQSNEEGFTFPITQPSAQTHNTLSEPPLTLTFSASALNPQHSNSNAADAGADSEDEIGTFDLDPTMISDWDRAIQLINDGYAAEALKLIEHLLDKADSPEEILKALENAYEISLMLYDMGYRDHSMTLLNNVLDYASMEELSTLASDYSFVGYQINTVMEQTRELHTKMSVTPDAAPSYAFAPAPPAPSFAA